MEAIMKPAALCADKMQKRHHIQLIIVFCLCRESRADLGLLLSAAVELIRQGERLELTGWFDDAAPASRSLKQKTLFGFKCVKQCSTHAHWPFVFLSISSSNRIDASRGIPIELGNRTLY